MVTWDIPNGIYPIFSKFKRFGMDGLWLGFVVYMNILWLVWQVARR